MFRHIHVHVVVVVMLLFMLLLLLHVHVCCCCCCCAVHVHVVVCCMLLLACEGVTALAGHMGGHFDDAAAKVIGELDELHAARRFEVSEWREEARVFHRKAREPREVGLPWHHAGTRQSQRKRRKPAGESGTCAHPALHERLDCDEKEERVPRRRKAHCRLQVRRR
jgi:hypothetical protein